VTSAGGLSAPATLTATAGATTAHVPAARKPATSFHDTLASAKDKLEPVKGHAYSKVVSGPDKGLYVNTTHNARAGRTFSIEIHDGRRWNVYGKGADRTIIAFPKSPAAAAETPAAGAKDGAGTTGTQAGTAKGKSSPATTTPVTTPPASTPGTGRTTTAPTFDDDLADETPAGGLGA
jgi:hypothetical protein